MSAIAPFNQNTKRLLDRVLKCSNQTILDAGAGDCAISLWLADHGYKVLASDIIFPVTKNISVKLNNECKGSLRLIYQDLRIEESIGKFDIILLLGVLHYAINDIELKKIVRSIIINLAPNGQLACSWILSTSPKRSDTIFYPTIAQVRTAFEAESLHLTDMWTAKVKHTHNEPHQHEIAYTSWVNHDKNKIGEPSYGTE